MDSNESTPDVIDTPVEVEEVAATPEAEDEGIDPNVKAVLQKERKFARDAEKRAREAEARLKELEDRDKTEAQRILEERDALKAERDALHMEQLRREVAEEHGLTAAQAKRLVGTTREELEADAEDVISAFPIKAKPVFGDVGQGSRGNSAQRVYSRAEISNFAFFEEHKADILLAQREGRITD